MYIKIFETEEEYTDIKHLDFSPQVDLVCDALPINEFSVDILTDDDISAGQRAELRDNDDNLWARYWIDYSERVDKDTVHIRARSEITLLDGVELGETMFVSTPLSTALDAIMVREAGGGLDAPIPYTLDSALSNATVVG